MRKCISCQEVVPGYTQLPLCERHLEDFFGFERPTPPTIANSQFQDHKQIYLDYYKDESNRVLLL